MSEVLVIRLSEDMNEASWLVVNEQGHRLSHPASGPLSAAAHQAEGRGVIVLVPGAQATVARVQLPTGRKMRIQQMLPFALEDAVAEDVDGLQFAAGPRDAEDFLPVAIVAKGRIDAWLQACTDAGIRPDKLFIETQGVPETPGSLTLLLENRRVFGKIPGRAPFVFDDLTLTEIFDVLASEQEPSEHLESIVVYADDDAYRAQEPHIQSVQERVTNLEVSVLPDGLLPRLAATLTAGAGSNLLQGDYAVKSDWGALVKPWRLPAALAAGLVVALLAGLAGRYFVLANDDEALTELLASNCQSAFATASLSACDSEIRSRLAVTGQQSGQPGDQSFLTTLGSIAEAADERMLFRAVSFRNGVMNLSIVAPDVQSLDDLAQTLSSDGPLQATIQAATPGDDGIEGRLQIADAGQ